MVLLRKALRTMAEHKGRYLGSVALLLIGSMMFVLMVSTSANLDLTFRSFAERNALSDAEFSTGSELDTVAVGEALSADVEAGGVADVDAGPGRTLRVFRLMDRVNVPAASSGRLPGPSEILLDELFATTNGYPIGSSITLAGKAYTVSGYGYLPNFIYVMRSKDELIRDPAAFGIGVLAQADFDTLPGHARVYALRFHDRDGLQAQETAARSALRADGVHLVNWQNTARKTNVSYVPMEVDVLSTMSRAVPGAILVLVCLLLGMLLWRVVRAEAAQLGALAAFGYRLRALQLHYLTFPLVVAVTGGVLGVLAGVGRTPLMVDFMLTALPMPALGVAFDPWTVIGAALVPVLVLCGVTWLVVRRVLRARPADLMKGSADTRGPNRLERGLRLDRLPFTAKFQVREQVRSISRSVFLLLGVVAATMLTLYGLTMKSSVDYMLNDGIRDLYNLRYEYVFNEPRQGEPPAGTEQFSAAYVSLADDEETTFYVTGILPDTQRMRLRAPSGQPLTGAQNTLTAPLAGRLGVGIGDSLTVIDTDDGTRHSFVIEALADTYAGGFLFVPLDRFNTEFGYPDGSFLGVWSDEQLSFAPGEVASTKSLDSIVQAFGSLLDQMGPMIYGLIAAALVVGLIVIYIVTGLVVDENRTTISLMKVFGYSPRSINRLTLDANTLLVVLGYLLGIPALLGTVNVFYGSLTQSLQLVLPVRLDVGYMVVGLVVILAAYELAKLLCRRKVAAVPMSEAIKAGTE